MMKKKNYLFGLLLVFILIFTTGCGLLSKGKEFVDGADNAGTDEQVETDEQSKEEAGDDLGDYHVVFSGDIEETDNQLIVHGESNLMPGSRLVGEVVVDEGETVYSDTSEIVQDDGSFYMELDHHEYGDAEINIRFDFDNVQEDEVKRHYGEKGQKLEGPFIYRHKEYDGILQKAEVRIEYEASGDNDLAIVAPDWEELPEDYGDPRVWIEADEITEDGEFFYVHGRSNLMEGSKIEVDYQYNRDDTRVNPDGSFDFKFDYEYLEDEDIIITFKPSQSAQWNEVEEAYGKNGQNLVGNLVQTNRHNSDQQYIEKRIEWDDDSSETNSDSDSSDDDKEKEDQEDVDDEDSDTEDKKDEDDKEK